MPFICVGVNAGHYEHQRSTTWWSTSAANVWEVGRVIPGAVEKYILGWQRVILICMNSNIFVWGASRPREGYTVMLYERTTVAPCDIRYTQQLLCITDQLSPLSCNHLVATANRAIT